MRNCHPTALGAALLRLIASAHRKSQWLQQLQFSAAMMKGRGCSVYLLRPWDLCMTPRARDAFEADKRQQSGAPSKILLQRKSPPAASHNPELKPTESAPEESSVQAAVSSASTASTADKSLPAAPAPTASQRSSRSASSALSSASSSERFASRSRDGSDPDYDRHYGKYAPRSAMVPAAMAWPVLPAAGGYGIPVAGIPVGAPYEAMSPM